MIIWIASYPKSGNTWVRALLSAYMYSDDGIFDFDYLNKINQFPKEDYFSQFSENFDHIKKVPKYWLESQRDINKKNKTIFFKTHHANCVVDGNYFTDKENTSGAVYIVRDPRNIVTSLAHHYELSIDDAYNFFTNERKFIMPRRKNPTMTNASIIGSWKHHYLSWKHIAFAPIKIIKYEDLLGDTHNVFVSILEFLKDLVKIKLDENRIEKALESCSFEVLKNKEKKEGFFESSISKNKNKKITFFHLGKKNNWKNILDPVMEKKISAVFSNEMKELGYL